ncbi:high-affinity branched-chain amino acid ABC transporter ATP-binding protein LivG [Marinobacter sp. EhC06]|jgi:branched-chain amino acid transport system ATP-binding protein|uniref:ABC transporter ATP-binding protein n=1 Tax=Marinobacter TaxID=2742 RepID=UPI0007D93F34|nr:MULTISPECIES: ABC transporter ATP-binding protein [unclassified Marinobacter]OAN90634.1 high-affinity branched-chain amino acid ABC transporter ATP-binding protein LivG [Marinobacter sp. EhN04]OAN95419.1 high-affinity branched-chain amino acid ABC transporter ATP-binding protein LivG [Marinobacter sp. EhC06]
MSALEVISLSKEFGGVHAIEDLSFNISPGSVHSIIGPNGAGKTTLLNLITGIYQPTQGEVRLFGDSMAGMPVHARVMAGLGRTFQTPQVCMHMTALENVMLGRHIHLDGRFLPTALRLPRILSGEREARHRAAELMEYVGLADYLNDEPGSMPYGALKRLEVARALACEPKLLLLDEPAAGLGASEKADLTGLIEKLSGAGLTIVLVEHDMKLVMSISQHILVINYGQKLAEGQPTEVRRNPDVVAAYLGSAV